MKKTKIIIFILAILCLIKFLYIQNFNIKNYVYKHKYTNMTKNLKEITKEDILLLETKKEPYIVYFGSMDCKYCIRNTDNTKNILNYFKKNKIHIYRYPINMKTSQFEQTLNYFNLEAIPSIIYYNGVSRKKIDYKIINQGKNNKEIENFSKGE